MARAPKDVGKLAEGWLAGGAVVEADVAAMRTSPEIARNPLRIAVADTSLPLRARGVAGAMLLAIGDDSGLGAIAEALTDGQRRDKVDVLLALEKAVDGLQAPKSVAPLVLSRLDDPEGHVRGVAAAVASRLALADTYPRILSLLDDPDAFARGQAAMAVGHARMAGWQDALERLAVTGPRNDATAEILIALANDGRSTTALERAAEMAVDPTSPLGASSKVLDALRLFLSSPVAQIRAHARDIVRERVIATQYVGWLRLLANTPDPTDLPTLLEMLARGRGPDASRYASVAIPEALRYLGEIGRGTEVLAAIRPFLRTREFDAVGAAAVGQLAAGTNDPELLDEMQAAGERTVNSAAVIATAILRVGGNAAWPRLAGLRHRIPDSQLADLQWAAEDRTPASALARCVDLGLLPPPAPKPVRGRPGQSALHVFLASLEKVGALFRFDTETSAYPARHDHLLEQMAEKSRGAFLPEECEEEWLQKTPGDTSAPYRVRFVLAGQRFEFDADNVGDAYDVEAVLGGVNRALAEVGSDVRWFAIAPDGQYACLMLATPEAMRVAFAELLLPPPDAT
jgi:hypothetical protein